MPATRETKSTIESALVVDAALARPEGVTVRELCEQLGGANGHVPKAVADRPPQSETAFVPPIVSEDTLRRIADALERIAEAQELIATK